MQNLKVNQSGRPVPPQSLPPASFSNPAPAPYPPTGAVPTSDPSGSSQVGANAAADSASSKLRAAQMPRPCFMEPPCGTPREMYLKHGGPAAPPPNANMDYIGTDEGSAMLRFVRFSTSCVAPTAALQSKSGIPLGAVTIPFSDVEPGEYEPRVVDLRTHSAGGPLRCKRCQCYANPGFRFLGGGGKFECNICHLVNEVPNQHLAAIDPSTGLRVDSDTRPEFQFGSVDYLVGSKDYCLRDPKPAAYVFVLDVSTSSVRSGAAFIALNAIRFLLSNAELMIPGVGATVSIITFDNTVHFYDARGIVDTDEDDDSQARQPEILYVTDVDEPFVPLGGSGLRSTPKQALKVLDCIQSAFLSSESSVSQGGDAAFRTSSLNCFGAALKAAQLALSDIGGKVFAMSTNLCQIGVGKLERRGGVSAASIGSEERECELLKASSDFYDKLGAEFTEAYSSVDIFLLPTSGSQVDAATVMRTARACGGHTYLFSDFQAWRDADTFARSLVRSVTSVRAFDAMIRVRVSAGLECSEYIGHYGRPRSGHEIIAPVMNKDSCLSIMLSHEGDLTAEQERSNNVRRGNASGVDLTTLPCVQVAVLYTDPSGQRRIRVHSSFLTVSTSLADIFKVADVDCVLSLLAKRSAQAALFGGLGISKARDAFIGKSVHALFVYRKYCAASSSTVQLILPDALKVLPVSVLGLAKSVAFRNLSSANAYGFGIDDRAASLFQIGWASPSTISALAYPRVYLLDSLPENAGDHFEPNQSLYGSDQEQLAIVRESEPVAIPNSVSAATESIAPSSLVFVDRGTELALIVSPQISPELAQDALITLNPHPDQSNQQPRLLIRGTISAPGEAPKSELGERMTKIVERILERRPSVCSIRVFFKGEPESADASIYQPLLVEDKGGGFGLGYLEFLRYVHRKIMDQYSKDSVLKELLMWDKLEQGY